MYMFVCFICICIKSLPAIYFIPVKICCYMIKFDICLMNVIFLINSYAQISFYKFDYKKILEREGKKVSYNTYSVIRKDYKI